MILGLWHSEAYSRWNHGEFHGEEMGELWKGTAHASLGSLGCPYNTLLSSSPGRQRLLHLVFSINLEKF